MVDVIPLILERFAASATKPKYQRLLDVVIQLISADALPNGTRFPPDNVMAAELGVSLGTVQKALVRLEAEGFVSRAPRRGTVVDASQVASDVIYIFRFRDARTGELIRPQVRMLGITADDGPGPWRDPLGVEQAVRFERLLRIDMEPPVYSEVFAPKACAEDLLDMPPEQLNGSSLHRQIEEKTGAPILRSRQFVHMAPLTPAACRHLMLAEETVGLIWDIVTFSSDGSPVTFQRIQLPANHRPVEFDIETNLGANRSARI